MQVAAPYSPVERAGSHARGERLRACDVSPLPFGQAAERPVAAEPRGENLPKGKVGPQRGRFALAERENLTSCRAGRMSGRFAMAHGRRRGEAVGFAPR